ncbi:MAG: hypothetical protein KDD65_15320 [Bacteroidetes bacterium]|nr:hypothetical protein [Bacteroidota bacterium]
MADTLNRVSEVYRLVDYTSTVAEDVANRQHAPVLESLPGTTYALESRDPAADIEA